MSTTWDTPAAVLIEHVADGWEGLWSLLYAASHATVKLSLSVPLTTSADLTFAAMDLREARDELEWLHEHLTTGAVAVDLGPLRPTDLHVDARQILGRLTDAILERTYALIDAGTTPAETACLRRVAGKVYTARATILGPVP